MTKTECLAKAVDLLQEARQKEREAGMLIFEAMNALQLPAPQPKKAWRLLKKATKLLYRV